LAPIIVDEHTIELAGAPVFYRRAPATGTPALYLHSVPTSSDDWEELLGETGGVAVDLLGFGRSSKAGNLEYTLPAYSDFIERFLDTLELDRVTLVGHGWGAAIGLAFAQRQPERLDRLAIIDAVPLLGGFKWPRSVSYLRRPALGELIMGSVNRRLLARALRFGTVSPEAWPNQRIKAVWEQFDQGTQRAILRLHRSLDVDGLEQAGAGLERLSQPSLVIWGESDPWLAPDLADAYGARLPNSTVIRVPDAGHWPWLDQPSVTEYIKAFVTGPPSVLRP
jgi:pimeloyl-ACP methyl ester carboxylesterase